jgi:hypothetical protein
MRTTTLALLVSLSACVSPIGEREHEGFGPDAGVDGSTATGACDDLEIVTMNLTVSGSSNFNGLPTTCWRLNGKLVITGPAITSVAKLGDLREVNDLEINDADLATFDTKAPVEVSGDIFIHANDKLTDITNVAAKSTVKSIRVEYNAALTKLGGLSRVNVVSGATSIANNAKLSTVELGSAQRLEGGLSVTDNGALGTITLTGMQSVGNLTIARNPVLSNIGSMAAMTNIHGTFTIDDNDAITTLSSLGTGVTIDLGLVISNNLKLADTGQLQHATRIFGTIAVTSNAALDVSYAHDIGCCVSSAGFAASNNKTTQCDGQHYCLQTQQNCFH